MRELPSNGSRNLWGTESVGEKRHAGGGCGPDNVRCRGGGVRLRGATLRSALDSASLAGQHYLTL